MKVDVYPVKSRDLIRWCQIRFVTKGIFLCIWEFVKLDCVKYKLAWLTLIIFYILMMV